MNKAQRLLTCLAVLASLLPSSISRAAASDVQLEITPGAVQLAPGETAEVLIVLRNLTTEWLQDVELRWFTNTDAILQSDDRLSSRLRPDGSLAWPVYITQTLSGRMTGQIYFQVDYVREAADGSSDVPGVVIGVLGIQERPVETVDKIAAVRVETTLDLLQEPRPGLIFLVVSNIANVPITVTRLTPHRPDFIQLTVRDDIGIGVQVPPLTSHTFTIQAAVSDTAQIGKHRLLFEVELMWLESGRTVAGSLLAAHTVEVGVLGESDILTLLGVPSFVLLPGFLMFTTFLALSVRVSKKQIQQPPTPAEFGLISITLSLAAALLYPVITQLLNRPRNYLEGYGLLDIVLVWFGSVLLGAIAWMCGEAGLSMRKRWLQRKQRKANERQLQEIARRTPQKTDTPLRILEKMHLNEVTFPLTQVKIRKSIQCFAILPAEEGESDVWVMPPILLKRDPKNLQSQLPMQQLEQKEPVELLRVLEGLKGTWHADWDKVGPITGPTLIARKDIEWLTELPPRSVVEVE